MAIPLLNLGLTDDERRRRAVEEALRAGAFSRGVMPINPDSPPVRLPNIPMPARTLPPPPRGIPGGESPDAALRGLPPETPPPRPLAMPDMTNTPLPEFNPRPMTRVDEMTGALDEAVNRKEPRWKTGLRGAALGAVRGLATGQGLGAAAGGAIAGGAFGAINPRGAREMEFEQFKKPQIMERFGMEDRDASARASAEKALRDEQFNQARLEDLRAETEERRARTLKLGEAKPERQPAAQMKQGRNRRTGQIDYYNVLDPEQREIFEPYNLPRETTARSQRPAEVSRQAQTRLTALDAMKRKAERDWKEASRKPAGSAERQKAEAEAAQAQAAYNQEVARFGELYGEQFETGGFEGPNAWGYVKKRQGQRAQAAGAKPPAQRKATVGADFVNHVANTLKITPEEARRRIEADGYTVR